MISGVPLTKEDVFFIDDIDGTTPKNIEFVPLKRLMSAVCWRNNLVDVNDIERSSWCKYCGVLTSNWCYDKNEPEIIMCSVCATNRAFGIENKDVKK